MAQGYAFRNEKGEIFSGPGFDLERVREEVPLGEGTLLISGEDPKKEIEGLEQKLEEARAMAAAKDRFLASMSHDIRTPMNAIVGMTSLAKKHIDEKARIADALNKIETASSHLLSLINDVLDMSRINSGRISFSKEPFSVSDLLHDLLTIAEPQMKGKGHDWSLDLGEVFEENLIGDVLRLRQVYVNIISNAVKYTPAGGQIDLSVWEEKRGDRCALCFCCKDNGMGMSQDFLGRIFEPFERVRNNAVNQIEGTGLGMSIVKNIVEAMEGTIGIESEEGKGTSVTIQIPMAYEEKSVDISALSGKGILILEKDEKQRELFSRYLGERSLRYRLASSAQEAIDAITEAGFLGEDYQVAILGQEQEEGDIFDMASYLHKAHPEMVLVLVRRDDWAQVEYRAERCGIHHFIPAPFFRKSLLNGLNEALKEQGQGTGSASYPNLAGKHILLVEDNLINREIAKELLGLTGADIETAENGQEAVEAFEKRGEGYFALILMDVQMPVMDGYEATRLIREKEKGSVPIYAMTANTFAEDIEKARAAGMNGHIAKPIDIQALMQVLRRF